MTLGEGQHAELEVAPGPPEALALSPFVLAPVVTTATGGPAAASASAVTTAPPSGIRAG